jgi:putative membrane-bound dehydrogenase-like protein
MKNLMRVLPLLLLTSSLAIAQRGDKSGEVQKPLVPKEKIPAAPPLSPTEALKTLKVAPGFRVELVAAEPLVHDPIQIVFDPDGRMWVLEMSGFMPDVDGNNELEPVGKVVVLEDADGDGRMDKRTVFLDGLVMPRSICLIRDGLLVAEPPNLIFCRDTNGDGKADEKRVIFTDYATQADPKNGRRANIEHSSNGLLLTLDNWIYSANHTTRYRNNDGDWQKQPTAFRGQWGISQDDFGRLYYNSNPDELRMDLVPSAYLVRNAFYRGAAGINVQPQKDQTVWPARVNPGVNRGYRRDELREDGTLARHTSACAPVVYRGDQFPDDCRGNVFVCEPAGNLVRRDLLVEQNGQVTARNAYDKSEFLASTDERFRPVNLANGPDGCLYVVDMYHGVIQHHLYVTSYLRQQAESRDLVKGLHQGRIYRVVAEGRKPGPKPQLSRAVPLDLVRALSHRNGWWRDTAQRLLVEGQPPSTLPSLKELVRAGAEPLGRLHALWTLDGMGQLDKDTARTVLKSEQHSKIRAAAIRLSEPFLLNDLKGEMLAAVLDQAKVQHPDVQLQLALTLGQIKTPATEVAMMQLAQKQSANLYIRDALVTGLGGREVAFIERLAADKSWKDKQGEADKFIASLAKCVATQARADNVNRLLSLAATSTTPVWQQTALLDGMASVLVVPQRSGFSGRGRPPIPVKLVRLPKEPPTLAALRKSKDKPVRDALEKLDKLLAWPGKPGVPPEPVPRLLTAAEQARLEAGKPLYEASCGACHQPHGFGQEGLAPPLTDSEWVAGPDQRLARIVLHGVRGSLWVRGQRYDMDMPALGVFDDEQLASILTYIRRAWDHPFDPVDPATVAKIRAETSKRNDAWSEAELLNLK